MNRKDLVTFLVLEFVAIVWAGAVFSLFSSRLLAGGMAGAYFVLSAAWMLYRALRWKDRARALTPYALAVHLFGVSLPMVITRFMNADQPFESVKILGLEVPEFHRLSTSVFTFLMVATVVDLVRVGLRGRTARNS